MTHIIPYNKEPHIPQTFWEPECWTSLPMGAVHRWYDGKVEHLCVKIEAFVRSIMMVDPLTAQYHFEIRGVDRADELVMTDKGLQA